VRSSIGILDRVGPIAGPALGLRLAGVPITLDVRLVQVLLPRQQRSAADAVRACGLGLALLEAPDELAHHRLGNLILLAGKGVSVGDQVDEKDLPMALAEALQQMVPVEVSAFAAQQMVDIRAVEPLALLDESLLPDHLFRRHDQRLKPEHGARGGPAAPSLVHRCDAVPGGEDQVDEPGA